MIDFRVQARQSGKIRELLVMYEKNPGLLVCCTQGAKMSFQCAGIDAVTYTDDIFRCGKNFQKDFEWFYFDEFFNQELVSYNDILNLDSAGKNVIIRGTPTLNSRYPKWFHEHLKELYPEYCI